MPNEDFAHLKGPDRTLAMLMAELSERCWYAGWLDVLEYSLWDLATGGRPIDGGSAQDWGHCRDSSLQDDLNRLLKMAEAADRWIVWDDDADDVRAVPLAEWRQSHEAWRRALKRRPLAE
jgi:hypothetical protein